MNLLTDHLMIAEFENGRSRDGEHGRLAVALSGPSHCQHHPLRLERATITGLLLFIITH